MASSSTASTPDGQVQRLGHRNLTLWDAIAQSLSIGPIFSSAFVAFLIAGAAGGAAPLSTLIGAVGVLALGWVIALFASQPRGGAGAIYDYLRRFSPAFSLFAAGIYFFGTLTLDAAGFLVIGLLAAQVFATYLNLTIPFWAFGLVALVLILALNYLGIRLTTRVQLVLSALSAIPLLILAIAIIAHGGASGNTLAAFSPASVPSVPTSVPAAGIFPGILFAITLFIGFETSAVLGEEVKERNSIPRAVIWTVVITGVFYLLVIYASDIGFGLANSAKWASDPAPLDTLATRYVGSWLAILVDIAVLFDALVVMSAFMATTSRGMFSLARHQLLVSPLARISTRYRTPFGGIAAVGVVALLVLVIVTILTGSSPTNVLTVFGIMSTIGSLLIELIYIGLCIGAVRLLQQDPGKWWRWLFLLVAVITPILGIYGSVVPFPVWPQSLGIYFSLAIVLLSLIWTLVNKFAFPARLGKASDPHPWEVEEVVPETAPAS